MPIPIEKLRTLRTIVSHDRCPDGIISALILQDALADNGRLKVHFMQYGSPDMANLPATPGMIFCDFSPPPERVEEFVKAGAVVLDHHKTAEGVVKAFGDLGVYADEPGVSGATLAFREVWKPIYAVTDHYEVSMQYPDHVEEIAKLAGIRDTWQKTDSLWEDACIQAAGVMYPPIDYFVGQAGAIMGAEWRKLMWCGKIQIQKIRFRAARAVRDGFKFVTPKGTRVVVFENVKLTSDAAETAEASEFDLIVGFDFFVDQGTPKMILSTRSRTTFDCSALCKANGGGGHRQAAGFNIENPTLAPWLHVQERVLAYERPLLVELDLDVGEQGL